MAGIPRRHTELGAEGRAKWSVGRIGEARVKATSVTGGMASGGTRSSCTRARRHRRRDALRVPASHSKSPLLPHTEIAFMAAMSAGRRSTSATPHRRRPADSCVDREGIDRPAPPRYSRPSVQTERLIEQPGAYHAMTTRPSIARPADVTTHGATLTVAATVNGDGTARAPGDDRDLEAAAHQDSVRAPAIVAAA